MKSKLMLSLLLCGASILAALSGFGVSGPVILDTISPALEIISPTAGDQWYMGGTFSILWQAGDPYIAPAPIDIWYSLNGGVAYLPIVGDTANDGSEAWLVPQQQTDIARIKIQAVDLFGNASTMISGPFSITAVIPQPPQGVVVDTSNNVDAVISWQAVTHDVLGQPVTPAGYIILYSEVPFATDNSYYFLGETAGLAYTHFRVLLFRDHMYYRVIAYLDPDDQIGALLRNLAGEEGKQTLWADLVRQLALQGGN